MAENRWFKVWGREVLASIDLNSLTDHEERVWWRLLAAASNEEPRWTIEVTPVLARFCVSTPAKLAAALATFERRGMVRLEANAVTFVNAEKYQETPAARRKREQRERDRARTQPELEQNSAKTQPELGQNSAKTQPELGQNSAKTQPELDSETRPVDLEKRDGREDEKPRGYHRKTGEFESDDSGPGRDMSCDMSRPLSQDKRGTRHVTSHGSVPHIARARAAAIAITEEAEADPVGEAEAEAEAEAGVTRHAAAPADEDLYLGVRIPPGLRDRVIEHCEALGTRNLDTETVRAVIQCHEDLPAEDIDWARRELRRAVPRRAAWPSNVREVLAQRDGVSARPRQAPQQERIPTERIPTAEEVFEQIRNRPAVPVPDELEYLRANDPEAYERELARRERSRAKLAAHMAANGQAT